MIKFKKYLSVLLTTSILTIGCSLFFDNNVYAKDIKITRINGKDRYETSTKISQQGWTESYYAVLVNGNMYADSIVGSPLAYKFEAPILLINKENIPNNIVNELKRLKTKKVFIMGGEGVISKNVEKQLNSLGINVEERIVGKDRYSTALKVKHHLVSAESNNIYVVDGQDWQNAIAVSPMAVMTQCPIIYSSKNGVTNEVKQNINKEFHTFQVIGENNHDYVYNTQQGLTNGIQVLTLGNDKTSTNIEVYNTFKDKFRLDKIYVVSNKGFADGLCISNIAGASASPILFINENNKDTIIDFICQHRSEIDEIVAIGGENLVSQSWLDKMQEYIWGCFPPNTTPDRYKPIVVEADPSLFSEEYRQLLKEEEELNEYGKYLDKYGISQDKALQLIREKTGNNDLDILGEGFLSYIKTDNGRDITKRRFYEFFNPNILYVPKYLVDKEDGTLYKELENQKNVYTLLK